MSIPNNATTTVIRQGGVMRSENMTLDMKSLPHLMGVLTNLYSDRILAVIREYSTNAMDSHIAAGYPDKPITVKLPNLLFREPVFEVKDEGLGLSEEEVFDIYGSYGASTKRESNAVTGQLGLGCKSALTYTNMFTLAAIKDGRKGVFSVHLDTQGIPTITKLASSITDEHNGVTVTIPVQPEDIKKFAEKSAEFFMFWDVLPNGVNVKHYLDHEGVVDFGEGIVYVPCVTNGAHVLMGGVRYTIPSNSMDYHEYFHPYSLSGVCFLAEVGEVDFVPSRETVNFTKRTRQFLERKLDYLAVKAREIVSDILETSTSPYEAVFRIINVPRTINQIVYEMRRNDELLYKGMNVGSLHNIPVKLNGYGISGWRRTTLNAKPGTFKVVTSDEYKNGYFLAKAAEYVKITGTPIVVLEKTERHSELFTADDFVTKEYIYREVKKDAPKRVTTKRTSGFEARKVLEGRGAGVKSKTVTVVPNVSIYTTNAEIEKFLSAVGNITIPASLSGEDVWCIKERDVPRARKEGAKSLTEAVGKVYNELTNQLTDANLFSLRAEFPTMKGRVDTVSGIVERVASLFCSTTGGSNDLKKFREYLNQRSIAYQTPTFNGVRENITYGKLVRTSLTLGLDSTLCARAAAAMDDFIALYGKLREEYPLLFDESKLIQTYIDERTR